MNNNTKQLVISAVLSAAIVILCILFSSVSVLSKNVISIFIASFVGYFYKDISLKYSVISNTVITIILTIMYGVWLGLSMYLPMSLLGIIFSFAFKWDIKKYYLVCFPITIGLNLTRALVFSYMANLNILEYVKKAFNSKYFPVRLFNYEENIYLISFLICYILALSFAEIFMAQKIKNIASKLLDSKIQSVRG